MLYFNNNITHTNTMGNILTQIDFGAIIHTYNAIVLCITQKELKNV